MSTCHVVTHRSWIAEELAAGSQIAGIAVRDDYGFDIPNFRFGDCWWAPTEWLALARRTVDIPLSSPGSTLLPRLRPDVLDVALHDLPAISVPIFAKVAEAKVEALPAQVWPNAAAFVSAALAARVPAASRIHVTTRLIDFRIEVRCFVLDGVVQTASTYLVDGRTEGWAVDAWCLDAAAFAQGQISALGDQPDGWVLDVGLDTNGRWVVIETNPAFSSSPYDCDPVGVLLTLEAAANSTRWPWQPDPWIQATVARKRALRVA